MTQEETAAVLREAYDLRDEGEFEKARLVLEPVLQLESPPATALLLMAYCLQMVNTLDLPEIESLLRRGVGLSPDAADGYLELGHFMFVWRDDAVEARALLARARDLIAHMSISADLLEAGILENEDRFEEAANLLTNTAERFPRSELVRTRLLRLRK